MTEPPAPLNLAYYYADWIWPESSMDWVKNQLLFFDGVALALPEELASTLIDDDPVLALPLYEAGLLHNLDPAIWLSPTMASGIRKAGASAFESYRFMRENVMSLTTWHVRAPSEDDLIVEAELRKMGATPHSLYGAPPEEFRLMGNSVRATILAVLALALQTATTEHRIHPITDTSTWPLEGFENALTALGAREDRDYWPQRLRSWNRFDGLKFWMDGEGPAYERFSDNETLESLLSRVFSADVLGVGIDLEGVPLDEVLDFRRQHGAEYRAYAQDLRQFVLAAIAASPSQRAEMIRGRADAIADQASDLRRRGRTIARNASALAFAVAGASWTAFRGDAVGAVLGAMAAATAWNPPTKSTTAYTYLLSARRLESGYGRT